MNKVKQAGFTIVELLVVIVIIGILATIGFVTFANAQNSAKKSDVEATMSLAKSKLGEYYAQYNTYPQDEAALSTYLEETNNKTVSDKLAGINGIDVIEYLAEPGGCTVTESRDASGDLTGATGTCTSFTLTGLASYWGDNDPSNNKTIRP